MFIDSRWQRPINQVVSIPGDYDHDSLTVSDSPGRVGWSRLWLLALIVETGQIKAWILGRAVGYFPERCLNADVFFLPVVTTCGTGRPRERNRIFFEIIWPYFRGSEPLEDMLRICWDVLLRNCSKPLLRSRDFRFHSHSSIFFIVILVRNKMIGGHRRVDGGVPHKKMRLNSIYLGAYFLMN